MNTKNDQIYDVLGIGIGPFNMSIAALLSGIKNYKPCFIDQRSRDYYSWHEGMLINGSKLQVSCLKDLVTPIDPTNKYSFLNYLKYKKRIYQFLNKKTDCISRLEFIDYMNWVKNNINYLHFNVCAKNIKYTNNIFKVMTDDGIYSAKNLILGTGLRPNIPCDTKYLTGSTLFHNAEYLYRKNSLDKKSVLIIGGGQSGAEIFYDLLNSGNIRPKSVTWISRRPNFLPMDDSCFTNEYYTPSYVRNFYALSTEQKGYLLQMQKLTSDGISEELANNIFHMLYEYMFIKNNNVGITLLPYYDVKNIYKDKIYTVRVNNIDKSIERKINCQYIILCTGYKYQFPKYLKEMIYMIDICNEKYNVNYDYSLKWAHEDTNKIFILNAARHSHGVSDPNLSLMAWRSANIINSLLEKKYYDTSDKSFLFNKI